VQSLLQQVYTTTKKRGGAVQLVRVPRQLRDLVVVLNLLTVFDTLDDEASAMASPTA
jgi:ABC-type transporter Mla MlaB component